MREKGANAVAQVLGVRFRLSPSGRRSKPDEGDAGFASRSRMFVNHSGYLKDVRFGLSGGGGYAGSAASVDEFWAFAS